MWPLTIIKLLLGLPGLASGVVDVLKARSDADLAKHQADVAADTTVTQSTFSTWLAAQQSAAAQRQADRGSPWTEWMMPTAAAIALFHFGAVVLDTMPLFGHRVLGWAIAALPPAYESLQTTIICAVAGVVSVKSITGMVSSVFTRRP